MEQQQRAEPGTETGVMGYHARSFAWLMLIIGTFLATLAVEEVLVRSLLGNPTKIEQYAVMLAILLIIAFLTATLGLLLVAGASQWVVAAVAAGLARRYGRRSQALALLAVPAVAILTWYCFDYLTPSNMVLIPGPEFVPYQHGLTPSRYGMITAFQASVTLFTVIYTATATRKIGRRLPFACCAFAFVVGAGFATFRAYPLWEKYIAAEESISDDLEKTTIPIVGASSILSIDWTPDGRALLVRMILPDEIVTVTENGQSATTFPAGFSANAVNTVGTKVFTTRSSAKGSYLESIDLTDMQVERKLMNTVPFEEAFARPETYIGTSRSIMAIPLMSPFNNVRDRPHVLDLYDGTKLTKIASLSFAVGQILPGLVSASADGKVIAYSLPTASGSGAVEIRSLPDGALIGKLEGIFDTDVALSPDGKNIAVVEQRPELESTNGSDKWIRIFDVASRRLAGARAIFGACKAQQTDEGNWCRNYLPPRWSSDGRIVVYADGAAEQNTLRIWHPFGGAAMDRNLKIKVHFGLISLAPDGSSVAVEDFDDSVTIIRSKNGKAL